MSNTEEISSPPLPTVAPGRRRRWPLVATAVVVIAVVVGVVVVRSSGSSSKAPTAAVLPPKQQVLSAGGRELVSLLESGRTVTFHATYRALGDPSVLGGQLTSEVWQAPPRVREDTTLTQGATVVHTASFADDKSAHGCTQTNQNPWVCHAAALGSARGPQGLLATIGNDVSTRPVTVTDETVVGRKARCFTVSSDTASVELCATTAGVPVLIADGTTRFELVTLSSSAASSVFHPPAADTK